MAASRIAVDAMGGDNAPEAVVEGAIQALHQTEGELSVLLVGPEEQLHGLLASRPKAPEERLRIVDAPEAIGMGETPSTAVKQKPNSSIHQGLAAHHDDHADAFVSAGNTGAIMAASMFILQRIPGVERPSIAGFFPTLKGSSVVLDIGSNVDCKPAHLLQFARMGTVYARQVLKTDPPSVGLLNIGEEPGKGNEQVKAAHELLRDADDVHFVGNVEGGDLLFYAADIIICDGFVGNALLKFGESMSTVLSDMCQQEMERQGLAPDEQKLVAGVLDEVREGFDPEALGGAPLLGVNGNVLVGHGRSTADVIAQMIHSARTIATENVAHALEEAFQSSSA
ncbi:phosphate acyltransferase PlsX [Salinibacter ruber]|uniref:Phosphate acyltransferase n=1 Tax=Salinibacter ruber TaxID=146919 RepID=A0A9X2Z1A5_9BACT|nr:phosphate acyltransferase PlsX [Salinibacter ruber]MCS3859635.1 glycerol-3-phosphate acyltransferase PlsX [Salinibacter ruber]MCS3866544.1 glycerol-3-phosphate acyltransferase PlsX [Salinibacter ruber]MCS4151636.1 glycerol-3-phosphate acyltransferase PlsX [Salinibacter ruber]MCS4177636.1 glycerol-3-phosphate acyltransferase PlsX [Salinibacter ruber]